jgi:hypothetical protein
MKNREIKSLNIFKSRLLTLLYSFDLHKFLFFFIITILKLIGIIKLKTYESFLNLGINVYADFDELFLKIW